MNTKTMTAAIAGIGVSVGGGFGAVYIITQIMSASPVTQFIVALGAFGAGVGGFLASVSRN